MHKIFKVGYQKSYSEYLKGKIILSNFLCVFQFLLGVLYGIFSLIWIPGSAVYPLFGALLALTAWLLTKYNKYILARIILAISGFIVVSLYHAHIVAHGQPFIYPLYISVIGFSLMPWILFDTRENTLLIVTASFNAVFLIMHQQIVFHFGPDEGSSLFFNKTLYIISYFFGLSIIIIEMYLLQRSAVIADRKNNQLVNTLNTKQTDLEEINKQLSESNQKYFHLSNELSVLKENLIETVEQRTSELDKVNAESIEITQKFIELFQIMRDGFVRTTTGGKIIEANPSFCKMLGYNAKELENRTIGDISTRELMEFEIEIVKNQFKYQYYSDLYEKNYVNKEGQLVPAEVQLYKMNISGDTEIWGFIRDISDRKKAEAELKSSELAYREIFNITTSPIIIHDYDTLAIIDVNQAVLDMYGYTREEFMQLSVDEFSEGTPPYTTEDAFKLLRKAKIDQKIHFIWCDKRKDKSLFWTDNLMKVSTINERNVIMVISQDITEKREADMKLKKYHDQLEEMVIERTEKIEQQKAQLESTIQQLKQTQSHLVESEKMATIGVLTAGIAHEINNPVNFISSGMAGIKSSLDDYLTIFNAYTQITAQNVTEKLSKIKQLKKNLDFDDIAQSIPILLNSIQTGINRTTELINSLRHFSRQDDDGLKPYDIHNNLDSTLVILYHQYKNHIEIVKKYGSIPVISVRGGRINQVFMNILANAIQAISDQGKITIETFTKDDQVIIDISDTGCGIEENLINHIFEPFFTTKESGKGTGLGLSISKNIILNHKGSIKVTSRAGEGSTFTITLPVNQNVGG